MIPVKERQGLTWSRSYKKSSIEFGSTLEYQPIREAKIGHVAYLIAQFQRRIKVYAEILLTGLGLEL